MDCRKRLLVSLVVLVQCLQLAYSQIEGYSDIHFETKPQDTYATVSLGIAYFHCQAKGTLDSTNQEQLLDVRFIRNSQPMLNKFSPGGHHSYLIDGIDDLVVGLIVVPIEESDNGVMYRCQVYHNNTLVEGLITPAATLTVGDGRPPAIPLTLVSSSISQITVSWSNVVVPSNGVILQYRALVYKKSDNSVVSNTTIDNDDALQYTFTGLQSSTEYRLSIVGINSYGVGDETSLEGTTQAPVVPGPPSGLSFNTVFGDGNIFVSVEPPVINNQTMTPVTHYHLQYHPTNDPSNTVDIGPSLSTNPNIRVDNLNVGTSYTFRVRAENSAGLGAAIEEEYVVLAYTGTQSIAPSSSAPSLPNTPTVQTTPTTTPSTVVVVTQTSSTSTSATPSTGTVASTTITTGSIVITLTTLSPSVTTDNTVTEHRITSKTEEPPEHVPFTTTTTTTTGTISTSTTSTSSTPNTQTPSLTTTSTVNVQDSDSSKNANASDGSDLPFNAVVLAIGVIAFVIMVAIIVAAVLLVFFCVRSRKEDSNFTDFHPSPSPWTHKSTTNPKWDSKDGSIKDSPLSGSLSDDIELPIEGTRSASDSPRYIGPEDVKQHATKIEAEINGNAMSSTPV